METREQLDSWRQESLTQWKDARIVNAEWVDAWVWLWMHSYADFSQFSVELDGVSFREKHGDWLMVLKAHEGETPLVAFITSKNPTRCVLKARNFLRNGGLNWTRDKYR